MPGTDPRAATGTIFAELPDFPYLAELPGRGPGADLAEGVAAHVAEVRKRVPSATVVLQLDEPSLPTVLAGAVPTASGLNRITEIDDDAAAARLRAVLSAAGGPGLVHCCAPAVPFPVIKAAGAAAAGFDLGLLRRGEEDSLAEAVESGLGLLTGVIPFDGLRNQGS